MKTIVLHTAVRLVLLVVMCASSMGFTTILSYCTMSHSSECCCSNEENGQGTTNRSATPSIGDLSVDCNIQIVAGGVNPVALNVTADASVKSMTLDLIPSDPGVVPLPVVPHLSILAHANDIAPPVGDICIRDRALLI
jgi:hypothetical protein